MRKSGLSLITTLLTLAFLTTPSRAEAALITLQSSLTTNTLQSGTTAGSFNFGSSLTGQVLNGATLSFQFQDDGEWTLANHIVTGWYPTGSVDPDYYRYDNRYYNNDFEHATLTAAGQARGAGSTWSSSPTQSYSYQDWTRRCGFGCDYDYYTTYVSTSYSGYGGSFGVSYALDADALISMASTGLLTFTLAMGGDAYLTEHNLTLDITPAPEPPPVPEPASILLLGAGVAGAGVRRWRQRQS